jgi:hypothetical protein
MAVSPFAEVAAWRYGGMVQGRGERALSQTIPGLGFSMSLMLAQLLARKENGGRDITQNRR